MSSQPLPERQPDVLISDTVLAMARSFHAFSAIRRHQPEAVPGLDPTSFALLFTLAKGPQRVSTVAEELALDLSTVSRQVTSLAGLGLVTKGVDPEDRRAHVVRLTDAGNDAVDRVQQQRVEIYGEIFSGWSTPDLADLCTLMNRLADDLELRARTDTTR